MKTQLPTQSRIILPILTYFQQELLKVYPDKLLSMIVFGSYARGDFHADSDVDILLLFDTTFQHLSKNDVIFDLIVDLMIEKKIVITPLATKKMLFDTQKTPLYLNIKKEGIVLWTK
jgi:uncharacterized protein